MYWWPFRFLYVEVWMPCTRNYRHLVAGTAATLVLIAQTIEWSDQPVQFITQIGPLRGTGTVDGISVAFMDAYNPRWFPASFLSEVIEIANEVRHQRLARYPEIIEEKHLGEE